MAQTFKETAHLKTDRKKYEENYDRIFGKKDVQERAEAPTEEYHEQKKSEEIHYSWGYSLKTLDDLFKHYGIDSAWIEAQYETYSGEDKEDVNWNTERAGWSFIIEQVLLKVSQREEK